MNETARRCFLEWMFERFGKVGSHLVSVGSPSPVFNTSPSPLCVFCETH